MFYWRERNREVDFVVRAGKALVAIEVKASRTVSSQDMKGLRAFAEDWPQVRKIVVSLEPHPRTTEDRIEVLPMEQFLSHLWDETI